MGKKIMNTVLFLVVLGGCVYDAADREWFIRHDDL